MLVRDGEDHATRNVRIIDLTERHIMHPAMRGFVCMESSLL